MMKIHMHEDGGQLILEVEGRLTGAFVSVLEECWRTARENQQGRKIAVDLKNVTCVDWAGRRLLRLMQGEDVPFLRAGMATRDILALAMEQPDGNAD